MRTHSGLRLAVLAAAGLAAGCGGGSGTASPPPVVSVSISPSSSRIPVNGTLALTATVSGSSNTAVSWSVEEGAVGGNVNRSGAYSAPANSGIYHLKAVSVADATKSATATVRVHPVISATATATMTLSETRTFTATVAGTTNKGVTWAIRPSGSGGSISNSGVFTAPNTPGSLTLVATCLADPLEQATINVTVEAGSASGTIQ